MSRKIADVYETRKVGEVHKKSNAAGWFWVIAGFVLLAIIFG